MSNRKLLAAGMVVSYVLLVWVTAGLAYNRKYTSGSTGLSVTTSTQYVAFEHHTDLDGDGATTDEDFLANTVVIHNANAAAGDPCYYLLVNADGAAIAATTTNGSRIAANSTRTEVFDLAFGGQGWKGIAMVSAAGETCTAYVDAYGSVPVSP